MAYECKIILDSLAPSGGRLTTFEISFPRIILAEFNTHRMFSRNSASSRAIPVEKMLERLKKDPFMPRYWGKNQKGMQADVELTVDEQEKAKLEWAAHRQDSIDAANELLRIGVHKQLTNRLLEPHLWHTCIVSATGYENYFGLRDDREAAPEIQDIAHEMHVQYRRNSPQELKSGDWHLPYVTNVDAHDLLVDGYGIREMCAVSTGRCARVSYLTQDGKREPKLDIELAEERLLKSGHMSPFEHPAMALSTEEWKKYAHEAAELWIENQIPVGNFWGWLQFRKEKINEWCAKKPVLRTLIETQL